MKRTHIVIVTILFIVVFSTVAAKEYLTPEHKFVSTTLCSESGHCIEVVFDVTWYRHLFAPTELRGTITVDDKRYQSIDINSHKSFIEQLKKKFSTSPMFRFADESTQGHWMYAETVWLMYADDYARTRNFDAICMAILPGGGKAGRGTFYYGPASTAEEVAAILGNVKDWRAWLSGGTGEE